MNLNDAHPNSYGITLVVRIVVPVVGCIGAAVATISLLNTVNPLAAASGFLGLVMFIVALVDPRAGIYSLLLLCGYSDLVKRLLAFWGELSYGQLGYVLAAAPLVVTGLYVGLVARWTFHRMRIERTDVVLMLGIAALILINFWTSKQAGADGLTALKAATNTGVYAALLPVALRMIGSEHSMMKVFRHATFIFLPVALYGIYQAIFGLADFEYDYLRSGLTLGVNELSDIKPRPFSTLNTAGSLGDVSAIMCTLCLHPFIIGTARSMSFGQRWSRVALALIYFVACLISLVRHSPFILLVIPVAFFLFRTKARTVIFYTLAVAGFILLVVLSPWLLTRIADWDPSVYAKSAIAEQALRIQTYGDRLVGFANLTESGDMYSWFGLEELEKGSRSTSSHDPVSGVLVEHGVVGLLAMIAGAFFALKAAHAQLLRMPEGTSRQTALLFLAIMVGVLSSHLLFHGVVTVFPVNVLFWLLAGCLGALSISKESPLNASPSPSFRDREGSDKRRPFAFK
jgi:hypothetical protein